MTQKQREFKIHMHDNGYTIFKTDASLLKGKKVRHDSAIGDTYFDLGHHVSRVVSGFKIAPKGKSYINKRTGQVSRTGRFSYENVSYSKKDVSRPEKYIFTKYEKIQYFSKRRYNKDLTENQRKYACDMIEKLKKGVTPFIAKHYS